MSVVCVRGARINLADAAIDCLDVVANDVMAVAHRALAVRPQIAHRNAPSINRCAAAVGQTSALYPLELHANPIISAAPTEDIEVFGLALVSRVSVVVPTGTGAAMNGSLAALLADGIYIGGGVLLVILIILVVLLLMRRGV